jgi:hypothetical protein
MHKKPKNLQLPLREWPSADRDVWERATNAVDYFDELAPAARWSPMTQRQARCAYARWLGFVQRNLPQARGPAVCSGTFAPRAETEQRLIAELRTQVILPTP